MNELRIGDYRSADFLQDAKSFWGGIFGSVASLVFTEIFVCDSIM